MSQNPVPQNPASQAPEDAVILDAPSLTVHQGHEVEVDTTDMPADEQMPADYDPASAYAVDPDVSGEGTQTAS